MKFLLALLVGLVIDVAVSTENEYYDLDQANQYFENFTREYSKQYANEAEKKARFEIFKDNLRDVNRLNSHKLRSGFGPSATFGITQFMDLTQKEFQKKYTGLGYCDDFSNCTLLNEADVPDVVTPKSFDWRKKNVVTSVKDQGVCGSCYSFSVTGVLEAQNVLKGGDLIDLSKQQIVDCDKGSRGCQEGIMVQSLSSIMNLGGIMSEADYPYRATTDAYCRFNMDKAVLKVKSCAHYALKSQQKLKQLLYQTGPLSISLMAGNFQKYKKGVFSSRQCHTGVFDHAALIVGYGTDPKQGPYWIIKNSHGSHFGEKGYIRVQRGEGEESCGILGFPVVTAEIE